MALLSSLTLFWLLRLVTEDARAASIGVLIVLLCGRLVSESPFIATQYYGAFAFLRRYTPALPFPLFFLFCGTVWRGFTAHNRRGYLWSGCAGLIFAVMVYSYFYLWTAAFAWILCFGALWFIAHPQQRIRVTMRLGVFVVISGCALIPYLELLSLRAKPIDTDQALEVTHSPDLTRVCEIAGFLILLTLLYFAKKGYANCRSSIFIFAGSCGVLPILVFNQQIVTGRSLQPFHYEQFIANYVVVVGLVLTYHMVRTRLRIRPLLWIVFALTVGAITAIKEANDNLALNIQMDKAKPVFEALDELAMHSEQNGFALFNNSLLAASASTVSSVSELWSPNMYTYGSTTRDEQVERFYQYLYYLGVNEDSLEKSLIESPQTRAAFFGLPRLNRGLVSNFNVISDVEIHEQVKLYSSYIAKFSQEEAHRWPLSYLIAIDETPYDFSNLDRWYVRDAGRKVGGSIIYSLHLRSYGVTDK